MENTEKNSLNYPKLGMQLGKSPSELLEGEYSLMLNGGVQSIDSSVIKLTNRESNLLCSLFKKDYVVLFHLPINPNNKTIFFLYNPITQQSEIGYINNIYIEDKKDEEANCSDCNTPTIEDTPLEQIVQKELCTYNTIVSAPCLGFNLKDRIDATYRIDNNGITLYFSQTGKTLRYLELFDIPYKNLTDNKCQEPFVINELDCSKINVFKSYNQPCITTLSVDSGGSTLSGVYQFAIAYVADRLTPSNNYLPITNFTPLTHPIPIFQKQTTVATDYITDKSIKIQISDLDTNFDFFQLVVVRTVDNVSRAFLVNTFPINSSNFTYTYTGSNLDAPFSFDEVIRKRPVYESINGVIQANNHLLPYDLIEQKPLNLQPVVNLLHLQWQTIEANEDFYADPRNNHLKSFLRDEVYPFGIEFHSTDGYISPTFPLIGRQPNSDDISLIPPSDTNFITPPSNCASENRTQKWQFYNTAPPPSSSPCITPSLGGIKDYSDGSNCFNFPFQYGEFAYHESILRYPSNKEVWGDLCGKPIRHFKFPDFCTSPFIDNPSNSRTNKIYPIGVRLDVKQIKFILNKAVELNLITEEQKNKITSYRIKRGDRTNNKSIVAKGIMSDIMATPLFTVNSTAVKAIPIPITPLQFVHFPNYGFNDVRPFDPYLASVHPLIQTKRYSFYSPETSFNDPLLPTESKIEFVYHGNSVSQFHEVEKHATYVLLGQQAFIVANTLAFIEALIDLLTATSSSTFLGAVAIAGLQSVLFNYPSYAQDWLDIFQSIGRPYNPAIYKTAIGYYTNYKCIPKTEKFQQPISNSRYLKDGKFEFIEDNELVRLNNWLRETSVYLSHPTAYKPTHIITGDLSLKDESKNTFSKGVLACTLSVDRENYKISNHYTSIKNYVPDQYGEINQIQWVDTGYCGKIDWNDPTQDTLCETIFGGDTFLSRFSFKKKFPYFIQDRINFGIGEDVTYRYYSNIGSTTYYFNTMNEEGFLSGLSFIRDYMTIWFQPDVKLEYCGNPSSSSIFYHKGKMIMYDISIPYFIVESSYNLNFRHGENELEKSFYPAISNIEYWTQPFRVPLATPNYYFYNTTFSKSSSNNFYYILKDNFDSIEEERRRFLPNRVLYSQQYNYFNYFANDYYDFPFQDGKLIGLKNLEQTKILAIQENSSKVFNAYIKIPTSIETGIITTGQMFSELPQEFYKTDLGFAGGTHRQIISTPYGHFWVDVENPSIMFLSGQSLKDITLDTKDKKCKWFFRENLPFKIKHDFPEIDVDRNYQSLGIAMGWDNKYEVLYITKLDYQLKNKYKGKVVYTNNQFHYENLIISIDNPEFFYNKSWTISYSPTVDQFISFHSFQPLYYNSLETYFQTGIRNSIWNHNQTSKSYQVYYNKLYPFIIEYSIKNEIVDKILNNITYKAPFFRYVDSLNYYEVFDKTFNKAIIYTQNQSSGYLNLIVKQKNNPFQNLIPKISMVDNIIYTDVLTELTNDKFTFNQFIDRTNNKNNLQLQTNFNKQPLFHYLPDNPAYKELNPKSLSYAPQPFHPNHLISNYFTIRLINDKYSNYNIKPELFITNNSIYGN